MNYEIVVLDEKKRRLDSTLSDYKGRDPLIHQRRCDKLVTCLLGIYNIPQAPTVTQLRSAAKLLRRSAHEISTHYDDSIFEPAPYRALVEAATEHALEQGFIQD